VTVETQEVSTGLSESVVRALSRFEKAEGWPTGSVLFREGEQPRGVYIIHSGEIDQLFCSRTGTAKPLLTAGPGHILGLSCVVANKPHNCSATARTPSVTGFIDKDRFTSLLEEQPALWWSILQILSTDINSCYDCMKSLTHGR
jgi:CRP-like cAMP-binding protein